MYKEKRFGCSGCITTVLLLILIAVIAVAVVFLSVPAADSNSPPADTTDTANYIPNDNNSENFIDDKGSEKHSLWYDQLNDTEKAVYDRLVSQLRKGDMGCTFESINYDAYAEAVKRAVLAITYDYPEFFWLDGGYSASGYSGAGADNGKIEIKLSASTYWDESFDTAAYYADLDKKINEVVSIAEQYTDTFERVQAVHDYIISNTVYDHEALEDANSSAPSPESDYIYSAYGCLVNGRAVCSGYSKAFQMVMDELGIGCTYVTGDAGGPHGWNMISLDDEYYFIDVTWDDTDYDDDEMSEKYSSEHEYEYFGITTAALTKTHTIDEEFFDVPDCTATAYNYYVYNGYLLDAYDRDMFATIITDQSSEHKIVSVKFDSDTAYQNAVQDLISTGNWSMIPLLESQGSLRYICDDDHLIIKIYLY